MTLRQRMEGAPQSMPSSTETRHQPATTLAEQAEELRAQGRQRNEIVVGGIEEKPA